MSSPTNVSPWPVKVTLSPAANLSKINPRLSSVAEYSITGTSGSCAVVDFGGAVLGVPTTDTTTPATVESDVAAWVTANKS